MNSVTTILILIFLYLSAIHVYWAFSGTENAASTIPEANGKLLFRPSKAATLLVAFGLAGLALLSAILNWPAIVQINHLTYTIYIGWFSCFLFAARAVGDFKYVGFFKRITNTNFAKLDTKYYSPLCLLLSSLLGILSYSA